MAFTLFEGLMILAVGIIYYSTVISTVKVFVFFQDVKEIRNRSDEINKGLVEIKSKFSSLRT